MDLIITIDTEADDQWSRPKALTTENLGYVARFQALCDRFHFPPTYLCTHEIAAAPRFRQTLGEFQDSGRAEVGADLHPWSNPPFDASAGDGYEHHAFPHEMPVRLFERKLVELTGLIGEATGRSPTSYRAGRYGFSGEHVDILHRLGYVVDCSVTPHLSWRHVPGRPGGSGGADFRRARPGAYRLDPRDCCARGESGLLEVPITILFPHWPFRASSIGQRWWADRPRSLAGRLLGKLGQSPSWFRPGRGAGLAPMLAVYREARRLRLPYVMLMFHSSELMPAGSPYFPDDASIEALYVTFERLFRRLDDDGLRGVTLTQFATNCDNRPRPSGLREDSTCCVVDSGCSRISSSSKGSGSSATSSRRG